ncbi:MAG: sigma-54-dependent Fis family transcriptional regulator [Deltaproteobacteria bacterium]|jgi:DNA-binding NtrC family response regulator|nr:sigma-54-dependent Fis family transcriptional regulator [Deltaproteobacteria bacterium]
MAKVLLCDDEEALCRGMARLLRSVAHEVVTADGPGGRDRIARESFDVVVTDLRMPIVDGFDILDAVRAKSPSTPVIVMSGSAEVPDAVRAMRSGARDFLVKPVDLKCLEEALAAALGLPGAVPVAVPPDPIAWRDRHAPWLLGNDPTMLSVLSLVAQVADTNCTVLITGESGTGKELVARSLVAGSPRARKPFVAVNCAAIPSGLVESELFGHAKGAFTGATTARTGRFAEADGGTILLDEIGEMEPVMQTKLLRLIQDGVLRPVGEDVDQCIDVRILAATNRKLDSDVASGRFRADLFWRLNVIPVEVPPLRHRPTDIPLLCEHFIRRFNDKNHRSVTGLTPEALTALKQYNWPGNIRELENTIERLVVLKVSGPIGLADLPSHVRQSPTGRVTPLTPIPDLPTDGTDLRAILESVEDRMISEALERTGGNKNRAAELLGLNRTTLVEKLRRKRATTAS